MAKFTPNEMDLSQINGGNQFVNGDIVEADTLNKVIEGVAYAQENGGGSSGSSVEVVQSGGTSTTAVMSQKATTDAINSAKPNFGTDPVDGSLVISGGDYNFVYTPPSGGGGVTLYRHNLYCSGYIAVNSGDFITLTIINTDPTPITPTTLWNYIPSEVGCAIPISGRCGEDAAYMLRYEEEYEGSYILMIYYGTAASGFYGVDNITDWVTQIA